jgi:hypothetical protein
MRFAQSSKVAAESFLFFGVPYVVDKNGLYCPWKSELLSIVASRFCNLIDSFQPGNQFIQGMGQSCSLISSKLGDEQYLSTIFAYDLPSISSMLVLEKSWYVNSKDIVWVFSLQNSICWNI